MLVLRVCRVVFEEMGYLALLVNTPRRVKSGLNAVYGAIVLTLRSVADERRPSPEVPWSPSSPYTCLNCMLTEMSVHYTEVRGRFQAR